MFNGIFGLLSNDIGIPVGHSQHACLRQRPRRALRPARAFVWSSRCRWVPSHVLAVGDEAKAHAERTERIVAIRPLKDGVIADFEITEAMLRHFIHKVHNRRTLFKPRPRVVIAVPSGITEVKSAR